MANNDAIFNAVLMGAAGAGSERWIRSTNAADYDTFYTSVGALADAVDALIPAGSISTCQATLMQCLAFGVFSGRTPQGSNYSAIAQAIVACWTNGISRLEACAGGGGGSITIQVNGTDFPAEPILNFVGADIHGSDDPGVKTNVTFGAETVSVSHSPSLQQIGSSLVNPSFTASYGVAPTTATLTDTSGHSDDITSTPNAFNAPYTYTKTVYGQQVTWTVAVTSPEGPANGSVTVSWVQAVKYGSQVDPTVYDSAFIAGLASSSLQFGGGGTFAANVAVGASQFYATRTAFGITSLNFTVNGLPFAISKVAAAVPYTNSDGVTENYDVWMSDNTGLGAFNFVVS